MKRRHKDRLQLVHAGCHAVRIAAGDKRNPEPSSPRYRLKMHRLAVLLPESRHADW